jgi:hypothetical protein
MADELSVDDVRRMAADIGMSTLSEDELRELLRATQVARGRRTGLRTGTLELGDEPAHVFRPGTEQTQ